MDDAWRDENRFNAAARGRRWDLFFEFLSLPAHNKKWWLPIVIVLLLTAFLVILGRTALASFIYTVF